MKNKTKIDPDKIIISKPIKVTEGGINIYSDWAKILMIVFIFWIIFFLAK